MKLRWTYAGVAGAILIVAVGLGVWLLAGANSDPVIAEVEGIAIRQSHADSRIGGIASVHGDITASLGNEWRAIVFDSLVDDVIVRIEAESRGIEPTDEDIEEAVLNTRDLVGNDDDWEAWLSESNLDEDEVERRLALQIAANRVYDAVTADVTATADEVQQYYEGNPSEFTVDGALLPLAEVEETIRATIEDVKRDESYSDWISARRAEVTIEVMDDDWR